MEPMTSFGAEERMACGHGLSRLAYKCADCFDALAAEAADARTLRAERDSLVKERDEGRTEVELMAMAGEMMNRQLAAATARADKAEAELRQLRRATAPTPADPKNPAPAPASGAANPTTKEP